MSKPSMYLPSKPLKYELKRQIISTDVLIGPVIAVSFVILLGVGIVIDVMTNIESNIIFASTLILPMIVPFLLVPVNWVGYWYQGRHYRKRVRDWKAQCKKIKNEHQLKLAEYEFNEIMKFVKESRCKSQN
ncbi:sulfurtransferase [Salmonella enterica]|uniref:sulfurtransferase n=1 Tax=Salmonella enterica TaxID=28901 RepID=UPI0009B0B776|nr:sulfurtransferase [Salmonella enterica]